jgi:hypothetical protein
MQDEIKNSTGFDNVLKDKIKELNLSFDEIEKQLNIFHANIVKELQIQKLIEEDNYLYLYLGDVFDYENIIRTIILNLSN